ncbi:hypothetical protein SAMN03159407_2369 [Rhizobium sp. NFR12]|jgi:hypothetical protein|nr:hypothetical protein SAMN03159407_2369 [Rhizobium sp. NFR12]
MRPKSLVNDFLTKSRPSMGKNATSTTSIALLIVMTTIFAVLALDIAIPALVLSLMALSRWVVTLDLSPAEPEGETA